jgi:hypothetical protein
MNTDNKKSKRKRGRPKLAKGQQQEIIKSIRFRECDLHLFEKAAQKHNQDFSEWVRETLRQAI